MTNSENAKDFIDLKLAVPALAGDGWRKSARNTLEKLLGITTVRRLVTDAAQAKTHDVFGRSLEILDILVDSKGVPEAIQALPKTTGAIIIANHPFGGADALALCSLLAKSRPNDSKILANSLVYPAPKFPNYLLPLKILGEPNAARHNLKTLKTAAEHVSNGGLLGVFPAGGVSHYQPDSGEITDVAWSEHIARIALKAQVPVIPVKFFGRNPLWYQLLGKIHKLLRAAMIPRALLIMKHKTIKCRAGAVIHHQTLAEAKNPTAFLRDAVYSITE
ncbi:MAG: 1-acyl-sn-glycerol-3-phosphate acyltransferase [Akkermansiaceae bacterium]